MVWAGVLLGDDAMTYLRWDEKLIVDLLMSEVNIRCKTKGGHLQDLIS